MKDKFDFYDKLTGGFNELQKDAVVKEKAKAGTWRGGSSGCITSTGAVLGADPRQVVLRFLGIQTPVDYDTNLMFQAGLSNEEGFTELLDATDAEYKCEEEIPMAYRLNDEEMVTGRPDMVLGSTEDGDFIPELGIEFKLICSPFSAFGKAGWGKGEIDTKHLIQSCHYAGFFQIPWVLAYTSRVNYSFPFYAAKDRAAEEKHMLMPDHRAVKRGDTGKPFMIRPFQSFYDITLADNKDTFLLDGEPTDVSISGIRRFYEYCSDCIKNKEIPQKRSGSLDHFGVKQKKNKTLLYDDFKAADTFNGFDNWVESCRKIAEEL